MSRSGKPPPLLSVVCLWLALCLPSPGKVAAQSNGPCSTATRTIIVRKVSDIFERVTIPNTITVHLLFAKNLTLYLPIVLNEYFSCTILRPMNVRNGSIWLKTATSDFAPLQIVNTHNIYISRINVRLVLPADTRKPHVECSTLPDQGLNKPCPCPAVFVHNTRRITMFGSTILGRLDIYHSADSTFDHLKVFNFFRDYAAVRLGANGDAGHLRSSNILLSNNEIRGSEQGIFLHWETIGVSINNNYIHNFTKFGIACGWGASFVGDCFWNTFQRNYIETEPFVEFWGDGAGIYFNGKWTNPVNWMFDNYIKGGHHCVYYDWATSGVLVDGIVCINTWDGFKINNGKFNTVQNALMVNIQQLSGWISCQNWFDNNCAKFGGFWLSKIDDFELSDLWFKMWPRYRTVCTDTQIGDIPCNPSRKLRDKRWNGTMAAPAKITGNCSGLPTENSVDLILVNVKPLWAPLYRNCNESVPTVPLLNNMTWIAYNSSELIFDNETGGDFGISDPYSPIYVGRPGFRSVPLSIVGVQRENEKDIFTNFNSQVNW